jgi:hypothetical protein
MKPLAIGDIVSVHIGDDPTNEVYIGQIVEQWPMLYMKQADGVNLQIFRRGDDIRHLSDEEAMLWKLENA